MPRRAPINPEGYYHVGSRGTYGQPLFRNHDQYELFLELYERSARKYGWTTLTWALKRNHHHFVVKLTTGGLSEGMRELHGTFSRRIHAIYGQTGKGHLVRHAFFAREPYDLGDLQGACRYVDLNGYIPHGGDGSGEWRWCGYPATMGLEPPRGFHSPTELLSLFAPHPDEARAAYRQFIDDGIAERAMTLRQTKVPEVSRGRAVIQSGS